MLQTVRQMIYNCFSTNNRLGKHSFLSMKMIVFRTRVSMLVQFCLDFHFETLQKPGTQSTA